MAFPVFVDDQIATAAELNALVTETQNQLSSLSSLDIAWPLVAQGDLDMNGFSITNIIRFRKIFDASQYSTLQLALDAVAAVSGGCLLIPPNTTITADGVNINASNTIIVGCGKSSVLRLTAAASSGYLLRTSASSLQNVEIANLTLDGNVASPGAGQRGIVARRVTGFRMDNVWMKDFSGDFVALENDGTAGNACIDARITGLRATDGLADHLAGNDIDGLIVSDFVSSNPAAKSIDIEADGTASFLRDIRIGGESYSKSAGTAAVSILGAAATVSTNQTGVYLDAVHVRGGASDAFVIGDASKLLQEVHIRNCTAPGSGGDAFRVNSDEGSVIACSGKAATGDGLDIVVSLDILVRANDFRAAGALGIDASGTTNCHVFDNDVIGAVTEGIKRDTATGLICSNNQGDATPSAYTGWSQLTEITHTGDLVLTTKLTQTIPGNTIAQPGQGFRIRAFFGHSGAGSMNGHVNLGGTDLADVTVVSNEEGWAEVVVLNITSATQTSSAVTAVNVTVPDILSKSTTIDMTTDQDLTFTVQLTDNTATASIKFVCIELIGVNG